MSEVDYSELEQRLRSRLKELEDRLNNVEETLDEPANADFSERASEREGDEVLEGLGNAGLMEIRMIKAALARMDAGEYGICVNCGDEISPERLNAVPHAPRCKNCA
jgi:RNA polymerase-binding transcription factor DksA